MIIVPAPNTTSSFPLCHLIVSLIFFFSSEKFVMRPIFILAVLVCAVVVAGKDASKKK